jgi:hypothetical protein
MHRADSMQKNINKRSEKLFAHKHSLVQINGQWTINHWHHKNTFFSHSLPIDSNITNTHILFMNIVASIIHCERFEKFAVKFQNFANKVSRCEDFNIYAFHRLTKQPACNWEANKMLPDSSNAIGSSNSSSSISIRMTHLDLGIKSIYHFH